MNTQIETPVAVEATTVETVETPVEVEATEITLDQLLGITPEVDKLFVDDANYTGIRPLHELIKVLPEDAKKQLSNLRASVTRKEQALAAERKALAELRSQVESEKRAILSQVQSYVPNEAEIDIWSEEGQMALIEQRVNERLKQVFEPMQKQLEISEQTRKAEMFVAQNPDVRTDPEIKKATAELLVSRPELNLEDAYWIAKAKVSEVRNRNLQEQRSSYRAEQRDALSRTSTGAKTGQVGAPQFKKANGTFDSYAYLQYLKTTGKVK